MALGRSGRFGGRWRDSLARHATPRFWARCSNDNASVGSRSAMVRAESRFFFLSSASHRFGETPMAVLSDDFGSYLEGCLDLTRPPTKILLRRALDADGTRG